MPMWNRDRGRDLGDRARELASRAGDAVRRGFDRVRGEDDVPLGWRGGGRGDWGRSGEYGRWGGERYARGDLGDQHHAPFIRNRDDRDLTYRGVPGSNVHGGVDEGYGGSGRDESGYGSVHYDRDYGYGAFGSLRDRGFEDRPYDEPGIRRGRDDLHIRSSEYGRDDYDRDMRGWSREDLDSGDRGWRGRFRSMPQGYPGEREWGADWGRQQGRGWTGRGGFDRSRSGRDEGWGREGGMTRGWRGDAGRAFDEYGGYSHGLGDEPYYDRDDFRARYDREFRRDERDWF